MMNYNITTLTIEMIRMKIPKTLLLIKNAVIGLSVGVTAFTITNAIFNAWSIVPGPVGLSIFNILCYSAVWGVFIRSLWQGIALVYECVKESDDSDAKR